MDLQKQFNENAIKISECEDKIKSYEDELKVLKAKKEKSKDDKKQMEKLENSIALEKPYLTSLVNKETELRRDMRQVQEQLPR